MTENQTYTVDSKPRRVRPHERLQRIVSLLACDPEAFLPRPYPTFSQITEIFCNGGLSSQRSFAASARILAHSTGRVGLVTRSFFIVSCPLVRIGTAITSSVDMNFSLQANKEIRPLGEPQGDEMGSRLVKPYCAMALFDHRPA